MWASLVAHSKQDAFLEIQGKEEPLFSQTLDLERS